MNNSGSNKLMKILIENLQLGVLLSDEHQQIKLLNAEFCRLLQTEHDPEWYIGKDLQNLVLDSLFSRYLAPPEAVDVFVNSQDPFQDREIHLINGKVLSLTLIPINVDVDQHHKLWVLRDVSTQHRLQSTLMAAKENAEKANRFKTEFLSMMSHELKTPLNAILGFAQLLEFEQDATLNAAQRESVQEILSAGQHLNGLIDKILDAARIETHRLQVSMELINVQDAICDCVRIIRPVANEKNIEITVQNKMVSRVWIYADSVRFKQILLNLLTNAIKYNRQGGKVFIESLVTKRDVVINIKDTGLGIPEKELVNIFEPFYRTDGVTDSTEGTGIGLALVQQLVQLMGGQYGVASQEGKGSCFWVRFPKVDNEVNTNEDN